MFGKVAHSYLRVAQFVGNISLPLERQLNLRAEKNSSRVNKEPYRCNCFHREARAKEVWLCLGMRHTLASGALALPSPSPSEPQKLGSETHSSLPSSPVSRCFTQLNSLNTSVSFFPIPTQARRCNYLFVVQRKRVDCV